MQQEQERPPVKVFPTHDPDGNPLPPSPGHLPSVMFATALGGVVFGLGSVFYFKNAPQTNASTSSSAVTAATGNNSSLNVTGVTLVVVSSREAEALFYYCACGGWLHNYHVTQGDFILMMVFGGLLLVLGLLNIILIVYTRTVGYAAWAAANPGPARIFEAKGGYAGVTWLTEPEAKARTARFANRSGQQTTQVIVVTSANEVAEQSKHPEVALPDAPPYAPNPLFSAPPAAEVVEYESELTANGRGLMLGS
jgi:hypothetical protein